MTPGQAQAARRCPRRRKPRLRSPQNPQGPHKVCKRLIALDGYAKRRETEASRASSRCTAARRRLPHGRRGRLVVYVPPGGVSPLDYQQARDGRGGLGARRAALTGTRTKRRAPRTPRGTSGLDFFAGKAGRESTMRCPECRTRPHLSLKLYRDPANGGSLIRLVYCPTCEFRRASHVVATLGDADVVREGKAALRSRAPAPPVR